MSERVETYAKATTLALKKYQESGSKRKQCVKIVSTKRKASTLSLLRDMVDEDDKKKRKEKK